MEISFLDEVISEVEMWDVEGIIEALVAEIIIIK